MLDVSPDVSNGTRQFYGGVFDYLESNSYECQVGEIYRDSDTLYTC